MLKFALPVILTFLGIARSVSQQDAQSPRLVMYYDQWHPNASMDLICSKGVTHVILSFMLSHHLNNETFDPLWTANEPGHKWHVNALKSLKVNCPDVKVSLAVGGWNDDPEIGWRKTIESDANLSLFVHNLHRVLYGDFPIFENHQFDGVDIDWEYPGGNAVDYKSNPQAADRLLGETDGYAKLLQAIHADLSPDGKHLSIAVPGRPSDMLVFEDSAKAKTIFESVDFVNLMTYDLYNRRDNITAHHSSVEGTLATANAYLEKGLLPGKINLGFALYAKWAHVSGICTKLGGLGCDTFALEDSQGADTFQSGSMTFEMKNTLDVPQSFSVPDGGRCGPGTGAKCSPGFCCSSKGWCGDTPEHCGYGRCNPPYSGSDSCQGPDLWKSWKAALADPIDDSHAGGYTYFDPTDALFWTWDPIKYVQLKIDRIVKDKCLGGAMAWSFGEENASLPDHISALSN
ncbi:glycoside hydrolase [Pseudovirgaria hyperparasitica]|uniref:chitinase n=1 Tax=Pseudovirgaria hyperparasitica TaxID=470096 RepID=A0A6A6VT93_9PEZI|nr:glycoside hydrolase [Pseudovirgaria hyperparasitica]KAF2752457.1 glycoside hydrolase [Pseudovirgaria hyperparasitica]